MIRLPMFPLGGVHFPYSVIPLRVFEERYLRMLEDVLAADSRFGVVLIERGFEVGGGDVRFDVGTLAEIRAVSDLEDGQKAVVAAGLRRFRIERWIADDPYPLAEVTLLDESAEAPGDDELLSEATILLHRLLAVASELGSDTANFVPDITDDALVGGFHLAQMIPIGPLDAQRLLEEDSTSARLSQIIESLNDEMELIQLRLAEG